MNTFLLGTFIGFLLHNRLGKFVAMNKITAELREANSEKQGVKNNNDNYSFFSWLFTVTVGATVNFFNKENRKGTPLLEYKKMNQSFQDVDSQDEPNENFTTEIKFWLLSLLLGVKSRCKICWSNSNQHVALFRVFTSRKPLTEIAIMVKWTVGGDWNKIADWASLF